VRQLDITVLNVTDARCNRELQFKLHNVRVITKTRILLHMCNSWCIKGIFYDKMQGFEMFNIGNIILLQ